MPKPDEPADDVITDEDEEAAADRGAGAADEFELTPPPDGAQDEADG